MTSARVTDRYTLDREIGRGGSGAVWLGRDEVLGRAVAMKRIGMPPGDPDPDLARAEREARLAAAVNHGGVVAVFDLIETPDDHWLVMEYVEGRDLAARIRAEGPLGVDEAADVFARVADALAAAHGAGIVHRDVKPSNILIGHDGSVKLTDFGIARSQTDESLTNTGIVTGSPAYLSPEVASGRSATPASDVWSLGASLFHALAGAPPYPVNEGAGGVLGAMYRIVNEPPPRLRGGGWIAPLVEMTMTHDAAARPSAADVRDYLRPPVSTAGTGTAEALPAVRPAGDEAAAARLRTAALVGGGIVAALVLLGVLLLALPGGDDEAPPPSAEDTSSTTTPSETGSSEPETSEPPTQEPSDRRPTAQELEDFAAAYVDTAAADPRAGFSLLTDNYQRRSPEYTEFWSSVRNPRIQSVTADPGALQVTYVYRYIVQGEGPREERVTLSLVQQGDRLLIAGAEGQLL